MERIINSLLLYSINGTKHSLELFISLSDINKNCLMPSVHDTLKELAYKDVEDIKRTTCRDDIDFWLTARTVCA